MLYSFNGFEFNSVNLILTKDGEALSIRHTEARVLAVLLARAGTVLKKEEILSYVWQDKVVSEQVVFQNISNLRNLFGNEAIKTFPKRGYQWHLETKATLPEDYQSANSQSQLQASDTRQQSPFSGLAKKRSLWKQAALACVFFFVANMFYLQTDQAQGNGHPEIKMAYIPITNLDDKANTENNILALEDFARLDFTKLTHLDTELFANAIEIEYPKLSSDYPFVLTGKIRTYEQITYLDFMLKGPFAHWEAQLSGSSTSDTTEQLQQHLRQPVIYDLLSNPQLPELKLAKLSIAHQENPDDLNVLLKLGVTYYKTDELDKSMALMDKLISAALSQNKPQQMGIALLFQSKILRKKQLYALSALKLNRAIHYFEKINDLEHQWQSWYNHAILQHRQGDYLSAKEGLLKSAQLAYRVENKLGEIEAITTLVALAHHYQSDSDKYFYLQQIENKMTAYQFPDYHFAEVSYRYATFAKAMSEKEPHLMQVLELTSLIPEHWAAQSSRRQLMQYYIEQGKLIEAQALIDDITFDNANSSYLKTLMAKAEGQTTTMIGQAQRTFEQAQLAGDRALSLDAAQLLRDQGINYDFYSQYINDNATAHWLSINDSKQLALPPKTASD